MRKRSKYRPRRVLRDTLNFVLDGFAPMSEYSPQLLDLRLKNHEAMVALTQGRAGTPQMGVLIAMYNVTEALFKMGVGKEFATQVDAGREAIISIVERSHKVKKYVPTGDELQALNALIELHDAQMDVINVREMDSAIKLAQREINAGRATNLRKT